MLSRSRSWLYLQLDPTARNELGLSWVNKIVAVLIVLSIAVVIIETEERIYLQYKEFFDFIDVCFVVFFTTEYLFRVYCSVENQSFNGRFGRLRYIFSVPSLIDLIAIFPFYVTLGGNDTFILRIFRIARILALAKIGRFSIALKNVMMSFSDRRYELFISIVFAFGFILLSATVLHMAEGEIQPESFGSIPRSLWWGVATISKVGYGGALPVTVVGKICAGFMALSAIALVAMPTAILAAAFQDVFRRIKEEKETL